MIPHAEPPKLNQFFWFFLLTVCCFLLRAQGNSPQKAGTDSELPASWMIVGAQVADGTGAPLRRANVRVIGDRIAAVGNFRPYKGERVVNADGLVLAPGFIDIHNHSTEGLDKEPLAVSQISQGITTLVLGADGESPWPIGEFLAKHRRLPAAVNLAVLVGHATVRQLVMGDDYRRAARPEEIEQMGSRVARGMREGAVGFSTGLEYEVGSYSTTEEVIALARVVAASGGFYMTHIRDEADRSFEALREAITIGEQAHIPVQISHIKMGTVGVWDRAAEAVRLIEEARRRGLNITADCYPYDAWASTIKVLVPNRRYDDPPSVERALADVGGAANITLVNFSPHREYEFRTLADLANSRGVSPVEMYIAIVKEGDADVVCRSMNENDIRTFYTQPWVMVASDGGVGFRHPRGAGTFPKVLGRYVRELQWLALREAIRKMTSMPAARLKFADRGTIRDGMKADLVLFNPATVMDHSTFSDPQMLSGGIEKVFVNGELVWDSGRPTGARPGRVLSH